MESESGKSRFRVFSLKLGNQVFYFQKIIDRLRRLSVPPVVPKNEFSNFLMHFQNYFSSPFGEEGIPTVAPPWGMLLNYDLMVDVHGQFGKS